MLKATFLCKLFQKEQNPDYDSTISIIDLLISKIKTQKFAKTVVNLPACYQRLQNKFILYMYGDIAIWNDENKKTNNFLFEFWRQFWISDYSKSVKRKILMPWYLTAIKLCDLVSYFDLWAKYLSKNTYF